MRKGIKKKEKKEEMEKDANTEDLLAEWKSYQEEMNRLLKASGDHIENVAKMCYEGMKDNSLKMMESIKDLVESKKDLVESIKDLEATLSKHVNNTNSFKENTVKHQVKTRTENSKILSDIERLNEQHEKGNKALIENQKEVTTLKSQLSESCNKLNEQQSTTQLMARVDEISGHFVCLDEKVNQLQSDILEIKAMRQPPPPMQPFIVDHGGQNLLGPMPEWMLRQRKLNNIIIFGLSEVKGETCLQEQLEPLWKDIGIPDLAKEEWSGFRVGKSEDGRRRPVIVKFAQIGRKSEILSKAKNLKGKAGWLGVAIAHDLTKFQCQQDKKHELHLRAVVDERNATCSENDGQTWRVVGVRGARHVKLLPLM